VQAIDDDNTTGNFTGQHFALKDRRGTLDGGLADILHGLRQSGIRLILADLPAAALLALADLPEAQDTTIFNLQAMEDSLRGADCRANILHTAPSLAMLADGLAQYLVLKRWTNIFLVVGPSLADRDYAAAIRAAIAKFRLHLVAEKPWTYQPGAKLTDSGHFSTIAQIAEFTQGVHYDVLIVADRIGAFGDSLSYTTTEPRPVAGTQGLVPSAWTPVHGEWGAVQMQNRFRHHFGRPMGDQDYAAWLAVRAIGEAATRVASADPAMIAGYLRSDAFALPGYKGEPLSFRPWDGQLRQAILLADTVALVSVSPQTGFLHPLTDLDSLGVDRPESQCHAQR